MNKSTTRLPHAFALEHPHDRTWVLWIESPNGYFMLLAGGWPSARIAEACAMGFGYQIVDRAKGIVTVANQMVERPDLYAQQGAAVEEGGIIH